MEFPLPLPPVKHSNLRPRRPSVAPVAMTPPRGGSQPPSQDCTSSPLTRVSRILNIFIYKLSRTMLPWSPALIKLNQQETPVSACRRSQTSRLDNRCGSSVRARATTTIRMIIDGCSSVVL